MIEMNICKECLQEKEELTIHGLCWKCQITGSQVRKNGCGNCKKTKTTVSKEGNTTVITRSDI